MIPITASMLFDLIRCPHRLTMDIFGDPADRDMVSPFVQLLWERGFAHEAAVVGAVGESLCDLSAYKGDEKERQTLAAMDRGESLIYSGRLRADDLLGVPDLLRKSGDGYIAGDIKSGSGEEGGGDNDDGKPKVHYGVQLALYTDILEKLGRSAGRHGFIWDVHGDEVLYDLTALYGKRTPKRLWDNYRECLTEARSIVERSEKTRPAYSSGLCKNCVWYSSCLKTLEKSDDLTLIPFLGRTMRDAFGDRFNSIRKLAEINPEEFVTGKGRKTIFPGVGPDTLRKMQARAKLILMKNSKPYLREPVNLPQSNRELFFDIEVDPMRDVCYLHGFVERVHGQSDSENFISFFADEPAAEAECRAFSEAWSYIQKSRPCMIYYYSKYERTIYRKLQSRFPNVCTREEIEDMFDPSHAVDLYFDVVLRATEWPTRDYSIKSLARFLGFNWRDPHPSGAASIEWFDRWISTRDPDVRQRILDYNEDDCRATRVLLDGVRSMSM